MRKTLLLFTALVTLASCSKEVSTESLSRYLKAREQYEDGAIEKAGKEFSALAATNPGFHQAAFMAGKTAFLQGEVELAQAAFEKLVKKAPDHFDAAFWYARCLKHLGHSEEAEKAFLSLLSRNSQDSRILFQLALLKLEEEKVPDALEYLRRSALFGEELAMVFIRLGRLYYRYGLPEAALDELEKAEVLLGRDHQLEKPLRVLMEKIRQEAAGEPEE